MPLFKSAEPVDLSDPGEIEIPQEVSASIPDVGKWFLDWLPMPADPSTSVALETAVNRRRAANGWIPGGAFTDVPKLGRGQTPLTFLAVMAGGASSITTSVWGTFGIRGGEAKALSRTLENLVISQGHAAAASWALTARPQGHLRLDTLSDMLVRSWHDSVGFLTNGDLIRAFKNWK